jgi:hypothetical protein
VSTLAYDYRGQTAWLDRLAPEAHPMTHDLCASHAGSTTVPQGWHLEDQRSVAPLHPAPLEGEPAYRSQLAS